MIRIDESVIRTTPHTKVFKEAWLNDNAEELKETCLKTVESLLADKCDAELLSHTAKFLTYGEAMVLTGPMSDSALYTVIRSASGSVTEFYSAYRKVPVAEYESKRDKDKLDALVCNLLILVVSLYEDPRTIVFGKVDKEYTEFVTFGHKFKVSEAMAENFVLVIVDTIDDIEFKKLWLEAFHT